MSIISFLAIAMVVAVITLLLMNKGGKQSPENALQLKELSNLYEYRHFLSNATHIKIQLQRKLESVDYYSLPYKPLFSFSEIIILKKEITGRIEKLEGVILHQVISVEDFDYKIEQLHKRIDLLTLPLAAIEYNLAGNYHGTNIVA